MEYTKEARFRGSEFIRMATGSSRDILMALLSPEVFYTESEVDKLIHDFLKRKVDN